jgi:hypothetical protein
VFEDKSPGVNLQLPPGLSHAGKSLEVMHSITIKRGEVMAQLIELDGILNIVAVEYSIEYCATHPGWSWQHVD